MPRRSTSACVNAGRRRGLLATRRRWRWRCWGAIGRASDAGPTCAIRSPIASGCVDPGWRPGGSRRASSVRSIRSPQHVRSGASAPGAFWSRLSEAGAGGLGVCTGRTRGSDRNLVYLSIAKANGCCTICFTLRPPISAGAKRIFGSVFRTVAAKSSWVERSTLKLLRSARPEVSTTN